MTTVDRRQQDRETEARQRAGKWQTPTDQELREKRRTYLQTSKPALYRDFTSTELEAELDRAAARARETAASLIAAGEFPKQAWHRAIRQDLLDSETD